MPDILTISDLHCPWQHEDAFDFLADLKRQYKPNHVVCLGDEIDAHAYSLHVKEPDAPSPGDEWEQAIKSMRVLYRIFPRMMVCNGNHTLRPAKRAKEAGLPPALLKSLRDSLGAPEGWEWRDRWLIGGTVFVHGEGFSPGNGLRKAIASYRRNVVMGHLHIDAGILHSAGPFGSLWSMNAGCLIDEAAPVFRYAANSPTKPTLGTGLILDGIPHFIPLK